MYIVNNISHSEYEDITTNIIIIIIIYIYMTNIHIGMNNTYYVFKGMVRQEQE
jgi:hypothetical protein